MGVTAGPQSQAKRQVSEFARLDAAHMIHPSSRMDLHSPETVVIMERAQGIRIRDVEGNEWLDALSGLLNVSLGYGREEISNAVKVALDELSFCMLFHEQGHPRAAELGAALARLTPPGIEHFLLTLSGSDAIESALKFVRYANANRGRPEKHHVIGRFASYHGMSYGATSATGQAANWDGYGPLVPGFSHINQPTADRPDAAEELEQRILEIGPENVAAFIAEPMSLPSGLVIPPDDYWPRIRAICSQYDVVLIVDEVCCGFGRIGEWFGLSRWGVAPDMIVMSKAMNNGAVPMGAVGMTDELYEGITPAGKVLRHGFTTGGHPAACAAALATLGIFESQGIVQRSRELGEHLGSELLAAASSSEHIGEVRNVGMLAAIELRDNSGENTKPGAATQQFLETLHQSHVLVRAYPAIDTIIFGPALTSTEAEVSEVVARLAEAADTIDV